MTLLLDPQNLWLICHSSSRNWKNKKKKQLELTPELVFLNPVPSIPNTEEVSFVALAFDFSEATAVLANLPEPNQDVPANLSNPPEPRILLEPPF